MKIKIELTQMEIQNALKDAIDKKVEGLKIDWHERNNISFEGLVKFRSRKVRRVIMSLTAFLEVNR